MKINQPIEVVDLAENSHNYEDANNNNYEIYYTHNSEMTRSYLGGATRDILADYVSPYLSNICGYVRGDTTIRNRPARRTRVPANNKFVFISIDENLNLVVAAFIPPKNTYCILMKGYYTPNKETSWKELYNDTLQDMRTVFALRYSIQGHTL
jgi:hypothetical protein